jgi:hypothetical protein
MVAIIKHYRESIDINLKMKQDEIALLSNSPYSLAIVYPNAAKNKVIYRTKEKSLEVLFLNAIDKIRS